MTAHPVDTRHQHAGPAALRHEPRKEHEPPDRHRQIGIEPAVAERLAARREHVLQPGVPRLDELDRKPAGREVTQAREISIPAGNRGARLLGHRVVGQRNWLSSGRRNGLRTLEAKISKTVRRPSTLNVATNRSDCRVSTICTPSNIRNSAHGPSNLTPFEPEAGEGETVARTWLRPPGPGNCTGTAIWGP